jgi:predicted dehydrogenase
VTAANGPRTRVGLIGAGGIATRHAATVAACQHAELVAVADPAPDRAATLALRYGAAPFAGAEELLNGPELDAVLVCVPPFAHGAPELALIEAGLPFFVEKPLAVDLDTAERIAARLDGTGLLTGTGYHWRALGTFDRAADLLADHPAWLAVATWLDEVPPPAWWTDRAASGGQVVEQATHVVDVLRALVGEVAEVSAAAARAAPAAPGADVDQVGAATLRFASGAVGTLSSTSLLTWWDAMGVRLIGDGLLLELSADELLVRTADGERRYPAASDPRARNLAEFLDAVRGGPGPVRVPYAEALRTHRLACAIDRAAATGRPVTLN